MTSQREHVAIYPGSFDPFTYGHLDVVERGRKLFDRIIVAVGRHPGKESLFDSEERVEMAKQLVDGVVKREPGFAPVEVRSFQGLTVDAAREAGATVILRGIRNLSDLQYEVQQAVTNREVAQLETCFIVAGQSFAYTSSSLIKQIAAMGNDLSVLAPMVPPLVIERLRAKKQQGAHALTRLRANGE